MAWNMGGGGGWGMQGQQQMWGGQQHWGGQQQHYQPPQYYQQQQHGAAMQPPNMMMQQQQQQLQQQPQQQAQQGFNNTNNNAAGQEDRLVVMTTGNDSGDLVMQTLLGEYVPHGENHQRKVYKKIASTEVFIYFWDSRDGPSFEGWWFGRAVGGDEVWSHCANASMTPPTKGWKIPFAGPIRETLQIVPKTPGAQQAGAQQQAAPGATPPNLSQTQQQKLEQLRQHQQQAVQQQMQRQAAERQKVEQTRQQQMEQQRLKNEQGSKEQEEWLQKAAEEVGAAVKDCQAAMSQAPIEDACTSLDATKLKETEALLAPFLVKLRESQQKLLQSLSQAQQRVGNNSSAMESARAVQQQLREVGGQLQQALNRVKMATSRAQMQAQRQEAEAKDKAMQEAILSEPTKKVEVAEEAAEKALLTFALLEENAGVEDLDQVKPVVEQVEQTQKAAQVEVSSANIELSKKQPDVQKLTSPAIKQQVMAKLMELRQRLGTLGEKLLPLRNVRQEFNQRIAAKQAAQEMTMRITAAEMEVDKLEVSVGFVKEDPTNDEALQTTEKSIVMATAKVTGVQRQYDMKLAAAQGPVKQELGKLGERLEQLGTRLNDLKRAPQMVKEMKVAHGVLQATTLKFKAAEDAVKKVQELLDPCLEAKEAGTKFSREALDGIRDSETQALTANKNITAARVAISTNLIEVRRFQAEAQEAVRKTLDEYKTTLEALVETLNNTKKQRAEVKFAAALQEVEDALAAADEAAMKLREVAAPVCSEDIASAMPPEMLREHSATVAAASSAAAAALRNAQETLMRKQVEAKHRDAPEGLAGQLQSLHARLREVEKEVRSSRRLPAIVEEHLKVFAQVEEHTNKVQYIEAKAQSAEETTTELTQEGEEAEPPTPERVKEAEQAVSSSLFEAKEIGRQIEVMIKDQPDVKDELEALLPRLENVVKRIEDCLAKFREREERIKAKELLFDCTPKVIEAEEAVQHALQVARPLMHVVGADDAEEITDLDKAMATKDLEELLPHAHGAIVRAKRFLATKRLVAKKLADGGAGKIVNEELDSLTIRLEEGNQRLQEIRKAISHQKYSGMLSECTAKAEAAEKQLAAAKNAGDAVPKALEAVVGKPGASEALAKMQVQKALVAAGTAQEAAGHAIADAGSLLETQIQKVQAKEAPDSDIVKELEEMLANIKQFDTELQGEKQRVSDVEQGFVAKRLLEGGTKLMNALDDKMTKAESVVKPLVSGGKSKFAFLAAQTQVVQALKEYLKESGRNAVDLFKEMCGKDSNTVAEEAFVSSTQAACKSISNFSIKAAFEAIAGDSTGHITRETFLAHFLRNMRITSVVAMTSHLDVTEGKAIGKLEVDELFEVFGQLEGEKCSVRSDMGDAGMIRRVFGRRKLDKKEGYVTIYGNKGTTYLEPLEEEFPYLAALNEAEPLLEEASEACHETLAYLKKQSEEIPPQRRGPLHDARVELHKMWTSATQAQENGKEYKRAIQEARTRYADVMAREEAQRKEAKVKMEADKLVSEATGLVESIVARNEQLSGQADALIATKGAEEAKPTQAMMRIEQDLQALKSQAAAAVEKIGKTDYEKVRGTTSGPLAEARRALLKQKVRVSPMEHKIQKKIDMLVAARSRLADEARESVAYALRSHAHKEGISADELYEKLKRTTDGQIPVASLKAYVKTIPEANVLPGHLDLCLEGLSPAVTKLDFKGLVQEYLKCVREVAITEGLAVARGNATIRKLAVGEIVEVVGDRSVDKALGLQRINCKALSDGLTGWVTMRGNQGTSFLEPMEKPYFMCVMPTLLQSENAPDSNDVAELSAGMVVELLEGPRQAPPRELMRVKCKTASDGKLGWITQTAAGGRMNVELRTLLSVVKSTAITKEFDVALTSGIIRKIEVDEVLQKMGEERKDPERLLARVPVRAEADGVQGWATIKGTQGSTFLEEKTVHQVVHGPLALQTGFSSSSKTVRMIQQGEVVDVLDDPREEVLMGGMRARGRSISSPTGAQAEGWFSISDSEVEPWSTFHTCVRATDLLESVGPRAKVIRTIEADEALIVMEVTVPNKVGKASGEQLLKVRLERDGAVGYAAVRERTNAGAVVTLLQPVV